MLQEMQDTVSKATSSKLIEKIETGGRMLNSELRVSSENVPVNCEIFEEIKTWV